MRYLMIVLISIVFYGCAGKNAADVVKNPAAKETFIVDDNYQRVFKRLSEKYHECMMEGWAGAFADMQIDTQLYSEIGEGEIIHYMTNFGTKSYYFVAEIKRFDQNKTEVDAYVYYSTWKSVLPRIKVWAIEDNATCN